MAKHKSIDICVQQEKFPDRSYSATYEIPIQASAEEIVNTLLDFNRYHQWFPGGRGRIDGKEPIARLYSLVTLQMGRWPFVSQFKIRVVDLKAPRFVTLRFFEGDFIGQAECAIRPQADGELVQLKWQKAYPFSSRAQFWARWSGLVWHKKVNTQWLCALKTYLEKKTAGKEVKK